MKRGVGVRLPPFGRAGVGSPPHYLTEGQKDMRQKDRRTRLPPPFFGKQSDSVDYPKGGE